MTRPADLPRGVFLRLAVRERDVPVAVLLLGPGGGGCDCGLPLPAGAVLAATYGGVQRNGPPVRHLRHSHRSLHHCSGLLGDHWPHSVALPVPSC